MRMNATINIASVANIQIDQIKLDDEVEGSSDGFDFDFSSVSDIFVLFVGASVRENVGNSVGLGVRILEVGDFVGNLDGALVGDFVGVPEFLCPSSGH